MPTGKSFRTVAGYLEGEGIFCRRINRFETLQVAYPQLYSVTEKTKQPKDWVDILHTPGSRASLVKCHFRSHVCSASSICLFSYSDNAKERSRSHGRRGACRGLKGGRWRAWPWRSSHQRSVSPPSSRTGQKAALSVSSAAHE